MDPRLGDFSSASSIEVLSALLNNGEEEEDDESLSRIKHETDYLRRQIAELHDGAFSTPEALQKDKNSKEIWDVLEVPDGSEFHDSLDPREQPDYEMFFKQRVGSEDLFLGMSRKDPSTACCEELAVKIHLPNTKTSDVSLDIRRKFLDLRTPKYKLGLHLPHPVNEKTAKAKFKVDTETLEVTLTMVRDFDFVNFS